MDAQSLFQLITVILLPLHLRNLMNTLNCLWKQIKSSWRGFSRPVPPCLASSWPGKARRVIGFVLLPSAPGRTQSLMSLRAGKKFPDSSFLLQSGNLQILPTRLWPESRTGAECQPTLIFFSLWLFQQSAEFCHHQISLLCYCRQKRSGEKEPQRGRGVNTNKSALSKIYKGSDELVICSAAVRDAFPSGTVLKLSESGAMSGGGGLFSSHPAASQPPQPASRA